MEELVSYLADALVIAGLTILTIGVYGMFRLPDTYLKLHAASKTVLLGIIPILLAAALTGDLAILSRIILVAVVLILTTPIAAHAVAKASYMRETGLFPQSPVEPPSESSATQGDTERPETER